MLREKQCPSTFTREINYIQLSCPESEREIDCIQVSAREGNSIQDSSQSVIHMLLKQYSSQRPPRPPLSRIEFSKCTAHSSQSALHNAP